MDKQRSPEWFAKRTGKITGSNIGAILGCDPFRKPKDILRAMVRAHHKAESEFNGNIATDYGVKFQPFAQADFELESGLDVTETGFHVHPEHEWLGASPDGLVGSDEVIEIKCPYGKRDSKDFKSFTIQPHYFAQMQIELFCTGRSKCYFYQWSPVGSLLEVVDFSQLWINESLPKLKAFHDLYLSELDNEAHLADLVQTKEAQSIADEYTKAKAAMESAKLAMDEAKKKLIAVADGKKTNVSGLLVYPIERKGSISYSKAIKDLLPDADLTKYTGKPSNSWGIR
jgi:putative phage-type endonuclease